MAIPSVQSHQKIITDSIRHFSHSVGIKRCYHKHISPPSQLWIQETMMIFLSTRIYEGRRERHLHLAKWTLFPELQIDVIGVKVGINYILEQALAVGQG